MIRVLLLCLATLFAAAPLAPALAQSDFETLVAELPEGSYSDRAEVIEAIVATGDPRAEAVLTALGDGDLYLHEATDQVVIGTDVGREVLAHNALTGEEVGTFRSRDLDKVRVNNGLRRAIRSAIGALTLMSPDRDTRLSAARAMFTNPDESALELLDEALAAEADPAVKAVMEEARAAIILETDADIEDQRAAIATLVARGDRNALSLLLGAQGGIAPELADDIQAGIASVQQTLAVWEAGQNVWYGVSLGSVLLLAAIGLAITFGVMGVINMAHGEMVMLGAYVTYVIQETIRMNAPGLFDWSLAFAVPAAFLFTGLVGVGIERGVIRFLYGRPLETLLATWGISLILQQAVRTIFGPTNKEVGNPTWMSGSFDLGLLSITWSRLWIVVFAVAVFIALLMILNRTSAGLQMRAVTQNRRMASAMGIRTPFVDALTFGLGSGIAGMAGVALSQIDNVSPNLGQGYIIDSFMVVVFGGVGNLWGTLVGAMTLGVVNKFLEPYAGAVLGKILVLVFIILFIQRRPRGLFALKGRAVET